MTSKSKEELIINKINNEDFEEALTLLNEYYSTNSDYEKLKIPLIQKIFLKLINNRKFDEALNKIKIYKVQYPQYNKDIIKIESSIYYIMAKKEEEEEKIDDAIKHLEESLRLEPNNENCNLKLIAILVNKKELYSKALKKIIEFEKICSEENLKILKNLKAATLNNIALKLPENEEEKILSLLNQAIEEEENDLIKENRFTKFNNFYIKKFNNGKYDEIPALFKKAFKFKFLSNKLKNYLDINKYISDCLESLYGNKNYTIKKKYSNSINYFLEYIEKGKNENDFNGKYNRLQTCFLDNIENDYKSFKKFNESKNVDNSFSIIKKKNSTINNKETSSLNIISEKKNSTIEKNETSSLNIMKKKKISTIRNKKDSSFNIIKEEKNSIIGNNEKEEEEEELEMYKFIISKINFYIKKYKDNKFYRNLKSSIIYKFANIYFTNENNYKLSKILFNEFLKSKEGDCLDEMQIIANINLCNIMYDEQKYIEVYEKLESLIKIINKKIEEKEDIDFEWPDEYINNRIKGLEMKSLVSYIENQIYSNEFINLDKYFQSLYNIIEEIKDIIIDLEQLEKQLEDLKIEYRRKKLIYLMESKRYKKCIELCDLFVQNYQGQKYIIREIKQMKVDCLKEISNNLIKQNKKKEFMKLIKEISILQQEIDLELGLDETNKNLIDIMLKVMNEKAEYFNRNNLINVSETISDLGLQLDSKNIGLLTEKSISNSEKGYLYINKAIENNDIILSIQSDNLSAKLNKINNISNLSLKELNNKYINFLIDNINTNIIDEDSKILVGRSIDALIELIKKYDKQIYSLFINDKGKNIFPKLKLIDFSFQSKELQYNSSELLKIFYNSFKKKELITNNYGKGYICCNYLSWSFLTLSIIKIPIKIEDIYILDIIEKIILNDDIMLEVKVNILFLYSRMDPYFIEQLKICVIPLNFIESLLKFRDENSEFINISLQVLLSLVNIKTFVLRDSIKLFLLKYIEKNIKNNKFMINKSDIDEYFRKNKYDKSKLEFTIESIKENFKKLYYEELINKAYTDEEIDVQLLKYLKKNGIDLEFIINENKQKIKNNIEIIINIFSKYIKNNANEVKTKDLGYLNKIFEIDCDLYIKNSLINLIHEVSTKKDYKNEIPMNLLINISKEIVKLTINSSDDYTDANEFTLFFNQESVLLINENKINILIDILYNFLIKRKNNISNKIDSSIFNNLCFLFNNQKLNKKNKEKIIKILKDNEEELKGDIKNIFEMVDSTKKLEENYSDNVKISSMADIEEKIKDGYELNINTANALNNIIKDNKNDKEIMNQAISLINTNVTNNQKIDISLSENLVNMLFHENIVLDKNIFDNLVICLMNIVKNCKLDEQLRNNLYNNLLDFNKNKVLNKIELIVISLKIFTQKHYSENKKQILKCLSLLANENITKSNTQFKDIEEIILNSFNNRNLEKEIFNALVELLYKNIDFLDCISLCLVNSLKNKKKDEINIIIKSNLKKFQNLIIDNYINNNMIDILCKASFDIFFDFEILKVFVFFTIKIRDLIKEDCLEDLLSLISENRIKICEYHIKKMEDNLGLNGSFLLFIKMIETDEANLLKKVDISKIILYLYFDFENGFNLLHKIIKSKINFSNESLLQLSNYLYNNHNEDMLDNIYIQIKNLLLKISSFQPISKIVQDRLELEDFSFEKELDENKIFLLRDVLLENKMPKRYFNKIKNIINNKKIKHDIKAKIIIHIFLLSLEKGEIIPHELWKKLFLILSNLKELNELIYILKNKNSYEDIKKLFYEKFNTFLKNSRVEYEDKIQYLLKLIIIVEFRDILNIELQDSIIYLLKELSEDDSIQIIFWMVKDTLNLQHRKLLKNFIKNSSIKSYLEDIDFENNFEKNIRNNLYNVLLNKQITILCEKFQENIKENIEQVKYTILQYSPIEINEDSEAIILKYIQFLNIAIMDESLNIKRIYDYIEYFSVFQDNDNTEITSDKKYFENLKEKWIISKIKKEKNYCDDISKSLTQIFIKNDFENNIIKNFIKIIGIDSENELNSFFLFYEKNNINIDVLTNILFNNLNKQISLTELKEKIIFNLIDKYEETDYISKRFAKNIYTSCKWEVEEIYKFLNYGKNIFNKLNELQKDIMEDTFKKTHFSYDKKNNKGETLLDIFNNYDKNDWEYKIKQLGLPTKSENERNLDEIFSELLNNNSTINNDLLKSMEDINKIYYEIEYEFHKERGEKKKPIEKWNKEDILEWTNSPSTKENINKESFIPELLSVICQANRLSDTYLPRKVQIITILLFLFSPKNKGLFTQIKTGEGKTTIVAMLAAIYALRGKFVDVLTSSEVLAERDSKEKKKFYSMFNLNVTHAKNEKFHKYNIVYGDTLCFEGDLLRTIFKKDPTKSDSEHQRGQQCIIIDEVDNMCIDNLSQSTQLVSQFGGYSSINGIYPLIYQNLNIIDKFILEGKFPDITQDNIKEKTIEKLKQTTEKIIQEGIEQKIFVFPKHIEEFVKNQISNWCDSAYLAKNIYKPNIHYVISGKEGKKAIAPVDYENTGVVHLRMQWSNGIHQFLQLKHGVKLENESLNTTYLSHYIFIRKYISSRENNVYGLTGTLGTDSSQRLLKRLFDVNVIIVPTFRKSNFINLYPKIEKTEENWKKTILENILNPINNKRVILVICKTIKNVSILADDLKSKNYPEHLIERYERNDSDYSLKELYGPGSIIFATNLAGRGTDIKLTDEVEKNGGMHVILTFLPNNQRIEEQALGRTARSGKNGSGIIIIQNDSKILVKNENGREIVINKMFDIISTLREKQEKEKIEYIEKNRIDSLRLKSEIFNKFTSLFIELKKDLKLKKGYRKDKIDAIAKDVEEKWGLWMKKCGLDEEVDYKKKEEIEEAFENFKNEIKDNYFNTSSLYLLNPFNYISFDDYSSAYNRDEEACFYARYLSGMKDIDSIKTDNEKDNLKNKVNITCEKLQDNLQTSLEAMYATISNLHNPISDEKEEFQTYKDCQNDIKGKIDIIGQILGGLKENIQVIEDSKGSEKRELKRNKFVSISELSKNQDISLYFYSMKIEGYYKIKIEVKRDWLGIFFTICLGALEIVGGCFLYCYTGGRFGSELIEEGYNDIKYGVECLIGTKEFSWSEFKKKKLNFLIRTAVNLAINLLTSGFSIFKSQKKLGMKDVFKQVGKKLTKRAAIDIGVGAIKHLIGPDVMEKIIRAVREILRKGVINYFGNELKKLIPKEFRYAMSINVTIYKDKNPILRLLKEQLKNALYILKDLVQILIKVLLNLLSGNYKNILASLGNNILGILENGLKKSLNSLLNGTLSELKKLIIGKNESDAITTWTEYLVKGAQICKNLTEAENLTCILVENGVLSLDGELNNEEIFEKGKFEKLGNEKLKLNLGIGKNPIRNITKKFNINPQTEIEKKISDLIKEIKDRIHNEFQSLIYMLKDLYYYGIDFLNDKKEEVKSLIKSEINQYKDSIIQNSIDILNKLKKSIIDSDEFLIEETNKLEKNFMELPKNFNNKLKEFIKKIISDNFDDLCIIKIINNKININDFIKKIKNISYNLRQIFNEIVNNYIPIIEMIVKGFNIGGKLYTFIDHIKNKLTDILSLLNYQIIPIIDFVKKEKEELDKKGLLNFKLDKLEISIYSKNIFELLNNIKNYYVDSYKNNENELLENIDELIRCIYDLDDEIIKKEDEMLNILFTPFDTIINKLNEIPKKFEDKINQINSILEEKIDKISIELKDLAIKLFDKAIEKCEKFLNNKALEKGIIKGIKCADKFSTKSQDVLKKIVKKPTDLIEKLQKLVIGMNEYEQSSGMDETIEILNGDIVDALFDILLQALKSSEIGKILDKVSKSLLREMESTKKNLRTELKEMAAIPQEAPNYNIENLLMNNINKNSYFSEFKLEKVKLLLKNIIKIIGNIILNNFRNNFKYPEGSNTIIYINSKFGGNPFRKILIKQLEISLITLKDIIPVLNELIIKIISVLKFKDDPFDSFKNLIGEFSNSSFSKIKNALSKSLENIRIGILSIIKDLIKGKSTNKNSELILTWSDFFIKGIKICKTVSGSEKIIILLIENEIISIDGELNKEKILEMGNIKQIKIKNFPIKLKVDLKKKYKQLKSQIKQKISNEIKIDPKGKIMEIMADLEKDINISLKKEIEVIACNCSNLIEDGNKLILNKENECKTLIKNGINIYVEKIIKELIDALHSGRIIIKEEDNSGMNDIDNLYISIGDKINSIEDSINKNTEIIVTEFIQKIFGNNELINGLKEKININIIIDNIHQSSVKINDLILDIIKNSLTKINRALIFTNNMTKDDESKIIIELNEKIINLLKSFLFKFNNDIKPLIEYIKKVIIEFNELDIKEFLKEIIKIHINSLPLMNDINKRYEQLGIFIKDNINDKREDIFNNIEFLITSLLRIYDIIMEKENIILDKLFGPCYNSIDNLKQISYNIQNKINNVLLPIISSIIKEYLEKITDYCFNVLSKFIQKIDNCGNELIENVENNINTQLTKCKQVVVNMAEKGYSNFKNIFKKINFNKVDILLKEFEDLCADSKDYDEGEFENEILSELCDEIQKELKKLLFNCIKESELCELLKIDYTSLIKSLGLNKEEQEVSLKI